MESRLSIAVVLSAVDKMSRVIGGAVDTSVKKLDAMQKKADAMSKSAFEFGRNAGAIGLAIAAPLGMAINAAAKYETMNIALRTAFQGNEKAATEAFTAINKFAAKTPYELDEVMRGFIKLKNMGLDPSEKALTAYGNVASGMGKSLNDMVEAVADAATGEFERLKEFGIKAKSQGDMVSFTFQGVTTKVKKNSADIEKYLMMVGNTKFAGGIDAQSKSIAGQLSTLKDNANMVAVKIGNTLVPMLNRLFAAVTPVIDKVMAWIDKNPELTKTITLVAAGIAATALAASGLAFIFGGLMKIVSAVSTVASYGVKVFGFLAKAIQFLIPVIKAVTTFLAANPILLAIMAIAAAAFLIYKYWDQIKAFFVKLWAGIKDLFWKVVAWLKDWSFLFIGPIGLIFRYWDQIIGFFKNVWAKVREPFMNFFAWLAGVPGRMYDAGVNIVKSIWEGIKSMVDKPIEEIKKMVSKIRDFLPFSPAKTGPLRDIHRIRLVETIAESVKPMPLVKAMRATTAAAMLAATPAAGAGARPMAGGGAGGGGGVSVHYAPVINMGPGVQADQNFARMLKDHEQQIVRLIEEANRKASRTKY